MVSEHPRFIVGSCVNSKSIGGCLAKIVCRSRSSVGTICGIVFDLKTACRLLKNQFGGADRFENSSKVSRGGKDPIFI